MKLFMDSSTNYLYLALYDNHQEIDSLVRDGKQKHSETIIDYLEAFLLKNNLNVDDLDSIFVGRGPGSYTGVRISGTIAKVLALVRNLKLYSYSSIDLIIESIIVIINWLPLCIKKLLLKVRIPFHMMHY